MPTAILDGIETRYEVVGAGAPLLMFSPGGFDATLEKWRTLGIYAKVKPLDHLARAYRCVVFDRRECGESGGRVEAVSWDDFVAQGVALLDHLGIGAAHLMGGCMGCAPVVAFAAAHPERVASMILWWPVGGARYRIKGRQRFADHVAFARENGLGAVVDLVQREGKPFGGDPRGGPWASVIRRDARFAAEYAALPLAHYLDTVVEMAGNLLDRDTAPGAEPEDLMQLDIPALIVPGNDESHATSAARYLQECLPRSDYWDAPVSAQTEEAAAKRLLDFLAGARQEALTP